VEAKLSYTSAIDLEVLDAKVANGLGFAPVATESRTGGFSQSLPYATRNTLELTLFSTDRLDALVTYTPEIYANETVNTPAAQAASGDLTGTLSKNEVKRFDGEVWLEAGETYTFMVGGDDVESHLSVAGTELLHNETPSGLYENVEVTYTATETGFQSFVYMVKAGHGEGRFGLYIRSAEADNGQYWGLLADTEGRAADLSAVALTQADTDAMKSGVTLIGEGRSEKLTGSISHDLIFGGDGHDIIDGNLGEDILIGGAGADRIRMRVDGGTDLLIEQNSADWDFTTVVFDGVFSPLTGQVINDVLIAWTTLDGHVAIGSLERRTNGPDGTSQGSYKITSALVLAAQESADAMKVRVIDSNGEGKSLFDLLQDTQTLGANTTVFDLQSGQSIPLATRITTAISVWENEWTVLSAQERYQTAMSGIVDTDDQRLQALEDFMGEQGIVLKSQAIFNL